MLLNGRRPLIMGILNLTLDSFSGDGLLRQSDHVTAATELAAQMLADGADILDIGGESTRPGSVPIDAAEEIRRTAPVIAAIHAQFPDVPLSIDTMKADVAAAALDAGAVIVNDVTALQADPAIAPLVDAKNAWLVLMHNRSQASMVTRDAKIGGEFSAPSYGDIVHEVMADLKIRAEFAERAGVAREKIILDPGIGFGKTVTQNIVLCRDVDKMRSAGYPILLGPSRKSFIGRVLDTEVDQRLEGTAALVAISAFQGADIIRVHDVKFMARVAKMAEALRAGG